jgi:hypothetical protein
MIIMYFILSILVSILMASDLFISPGHSAYMDGIAHLTTLTQFYEAMKEGIWRVTWTDGFANYGMPIPLYIHQTVGYLGGWMSLLLKGDVVMVYKLLFLVGAVVSSAVFYKFLRIYFTPLASFLGVFIMNVSPYRILNLYIREALPEFLAAVLFPTILLATYKFIKKRSKWSGAILTSVFALIALSHPMMLVVGSVLFGGYFIFLIKDEENKMKLTINYFLHMAWGLLIAAYYLIPLKVEIKYFYYGQQDNHLTGGQYLKLANYFDPKWYYFYVRDVANRGHYVSGGLIESLIMITGSITVVYQFITRQVKKLQVWHFALAVGLILIYMTTKYSGWLYEHINLLSNIQFPWRMLSSYIYIPAILVASFFNKLDKHKWNEVLAVMFVVVVSMARFPQLYAKNNTMHDIARYYFTPINLHSTVMNTVWSGETTEYPIMDHKIEIIEGKGSLEVRDVRYGIRGYKIRAETDVRMVDYTFYFPGWEVRVDGQLVPVEFQDPSYRGVITYRIPQGEHNVKLYFGDTKLRKISNLITLISGSVFVIYLFILSLRKNKKQ